MSVKMKVNRLALIASIEKKIKEAEADYKTQLAEYEKKNKSSPKDWVSAVRQYALEVEKGTRYPDVDKYEFTHYISSRVTYPYKPNKPNIDQAIQAVKKLQMATDDVLLLSDNDFYFQYI